MKRLKDKDCEFLHVLIINQYLANMFAFGLLRMLHFMRDLPPPQLPTVVLQRLIVGLHVDCMDRFIA